MTTELVDEMIRKELAHIDMTIDRRDVHAVLDALRAILDECDREDQQPSTATGPGCWLATSEIRMRIAQALGLGGKASR